MLKALLFDLDGTLIQSDPVHLITWQTLLRPQGFAIDQDFFNTHISGRTNDAILQDILPHLSPTERGIFAETKEQQFRAQARSLKPTSGLPALLSWMQARSLKHAVVTNAPAANAHHMLHALGLSSVFSTLILAEDLPRSKPDPLPYQTALERLQVSASEALVFEDSPAGMRAAIAAGIPTVAIASTHPPSTLIALGATLVISDFTDRHLHRLLQTALTPAYSLA